MCHRGQSYFQLSVRGIGFLAGQRIVLPYKCTDYIGPQSPWGLRGFFMLMHLRGRCEEEAGGTNAFQKAQGKAPRPIWMRDGMQC